MPILVVAGGALALAFACWLIRRWRGRQLPVAPPDLMRWLRLLRAIAEDPAAAPRRRRVALRLHRQLRARRWRSRTLHRLIMVSARIGRRVLGALDCGVAAPGSDGHRQVRMASVLLAAELGVRAAGGTKDGTEAYG